MDKHLVLGEEVRSGSWWFGNTAEEDAEHRRALRDAARLAGSRERNYDQPWWAANVVALLDEVESLRALIDAGSLADPPPL